MQNQAQKISQKIAEIKPPKSLKKAVFKRLEAEKDKQIKTKMFLTNFGLAASGLLFFGTFFVFGKSFLQSEFWNIVSLLFSDFMIVAGNWREFLFSLGETFPVVNLIAMMLPIFGFLLLLNLFLSLKGKYKYIHTHIALC